MAYRISANSDGIIKACKAAFIYNQIMDYNNRYDATIGEGGVKLLGGKY